MTRIRTVKPELFRHFVLNQAEIKSGLPLRLAFIGLFCCCDREGRFRWQPESLKLDVLPYEQLDFNQVLNALAEAAFIRKYEIAGELYGCIPSWRKHQLPNNREAKSAIPAPVETSPNTASATELQGLVAKLKRAQVSLQQAAIPLIEEEQERFVMLKHAQASLTEPINPLTQDEGVCSETLKYEKVSSSVAEDRLNADHSARLVMLKQEKASLQTTADGITTSAIARSAMLKQDQGELEGEREKEGERKYKKESSDMSGSKLPDDRVLVDKFILPENNPSHPPPLKERPEVFRQRLREQAKEILIFLNAKAKRDYRPVDANLYLIVDRLRSGVTVLQCQQVIVKKTREWGQDPKMSNFLRPETLFNPVKFEQYVGELVFGYEGEEVRDVATQ